MLSFFNHPATTEIYTLSLHDALPIFERGGDGADEQQQPAEDDTHGGHLEGRDVEVADPAVEVEGTRAERDDDRGDREEPDRKSTRLNSSHVRISYAVFCLKKKKKI